MKVDRLSATDLSMLWPDDLGWPQDIGGLAILEGDDLVDPDGELRLEELRVRVEGKLHLLPHFRQCLRRPGFGQGLPYWSDDPRFEISHHVRVRQLTPPVTETRLLEACEELRRRRFDMSRPLWEFWCLTGLPDGKVGVFIKVHHTLADGAAGVAALAAFFDSTPDAPIRYVGGWAPSRPPSRAELVGDNLRERARRLRSLLRSLRHLGVSLTWVGRALGEVRRILSEGVAPRIGLNRPIGEKRRLAIVHDDLDRIKTLARAHDVTVNDVLLTAIAGGLRELLIGRGRSPAGLFPRAVVPIAGKSVSGTGNATASSLVVSLPVGEPDPLLRLEMIAADSRRWKEKPLSYDEAGILHSPLAERIAVRFAGRQRVANVYVANVPGPPTPYYMAGARILELIPFVPLVGNVTIGIGALSYAGQFNLTVVADHDACPDIDVFVEGMRRTLRRTQGSNHRLPGPGTLGSLSDEPAAQEHEVIG